MQQKITLKDQLQELKDNVSVKQAEVYLLKDVLEDTLRPAELSSEAVMIVLGMLIDVADHIKKNGKSDKSDLAKSRLIRLLDIMSEIGDLAAVNNNLKLSNTFLHGQNNVLRIDKNRLISELVDLKQQLNF